MSRAGAVARCWSAGTGSRAVVQSDRCVGSRKPLSQQRPSILVFIFVSFLVARCLQYDWVSGYCVRLRDESAHRMRMEESAGGTSRGPPGSAGLPRFHLFARSPAVSRLGNPPTIARLRTTASVHALRSISSPRNQLQTRIRIRPQPARKSSATASQLGWGFPVGVSWVNSGEGHGIWASQHHQSTLLCA